MRHLHYEFICSSFSLGLAVFLMGMSFWQLFLVGRGATGVIVPLWLSLTGSLLLGGILLMHAYAGIRSEIQQPKRSRHVR